MNPTKIAARNFRSYREIEVDLPYGPTAILGSNGSGKSSLVSIIPLALFGTRSFSDYLNDNAVEEDLEIALWFEHAHREYRIRRTYSPRGRGKTALDFEEFGEGCWIPRSKEDQRATQAEIEATIGLSQETFEASCYLGQGQGALFTEAAPRDRKRILGEVLGLGVWDGLLAKARADRAAVEADAGKLATRLEEADRELERRPEIGMKIGYERSEVEEAEKRVDATEYLHRQASEELAESRETAAQLAAARRLLAERTHARDGLEDRNRMLVRLLDEAQNLPDQLAEAGRLAAQERDLEQEKTEALHEAEVRKEVERLTVERNRILGEARAFSRKLAEVLAEAEHLAGLQSVSAEMCKTCGQRLTDEARQQTLAALRQEADDLEARAKGKVWVADADFAPLIKQAGERLDAAEGARALNLIAADLRRSRAAREEAASITERLRQVEALANEREELIAKRAAAETARVDAAREVRDLEVKIPAGDPEAAVARAYADLHEARTDLEGAKTRLAVAEAELKRLNGLEALAAENRRDLEQHQRDLDLLHLAERAYGPNGIPALVIENAAIPSIAVEAGRILAELGTEFRVELRTQREKKTGGVSETLDIVILSAAGERLYESLSGGERSRVNVALRIALARLLAHRRGAESRILVIDEPDGLDASGFERLAMILRGLGDDFERILVVSHHPDLRDAFDQTIAVERVDAGPSRIVGSRDLEEALA